MQHIELTKKHCPLFKGDERRELCERSGGGLKKESYNTPQAPHPAFGLVPLEEGQCRVH